MSVSRQGWRRGGKGAAEEEADGRVSCGSAHVADPRANQRERTRTAIMDATRTLLIEGKVPSIAEAAQAARVSRATAYRYFPSQGTLIQEAVKSVLVPAREWEGLLDGDGDLPGRVERLAAKVLDLMRENEALFRGALLLSLQQWARAQAGEELGEPPIKRGGRLEGIHAALEPFQEKLDPGALRRLAVAISIFIGIEGRIVMRDIWGLEEDEAEQITRWIARTLAGAAVEPAKPSSPARD